MSAALAEALTIASAGLLSFGQILLMLIVLSGARGLLKASLYAVGLFTSLLLIGQGALLVGSRLQAGAPDQGGGAVAAWLSLALGALLLSGAIRSLRRGPRPDQPRPWIFTSLDAARPSRMLGFGALAAVVNLKNLAIYLAAIDVITRARLPRSEGILSVLAINLVFCSCLLGPIGLRVLGGAWGARLLARFRRALERHHRPLSIGVMSLFGAAFALRGLSLLTR